MEDSYPLLRIELLMDSIAGHPLLSYMDAFFGYNQIKLDESYQEHGFQNRTIPGGQTVKTQNQDKNRFFKPKELDFL